MHTDTHIRNYVPGDFEDVADLWEATGMGGKFRGDDNLVIQNTIKLGGRLLILELTENAEIIGTSWLTLDGRRVYMHHFGIKPEYQGFGFSKILLKESMNFAKSTGLQIKLEVHRNNLKALKLYQKGGFLHLGDYDVYIIRDYNHF
jgi:ribosomal protein S18 acetylase RimI-like enzyme